MTVGSALQSAAIRLVGTRPTAIFSSSDKLSVELADLVNDVATDIAKAHEWGALVTLATLSGDGTTEGHELPGDYDRMPIKVKLWSTAWPGMYFEHAKDLDEWYDIRSFSSSGAPGWWIKFQSKVQIWPVLETGVDAQFYYISKNFGQDGDSIPISTFTADTDTFRLPERLLTLGIIWRWRSQKRLEYAEDLKNYEMALSQYIAQDRGSNIIVVGNRRLGTSLNTPWPGTIPA